MTKIPMAVLSLSLSYAFLLVLVVVVVGDVAATTDGADITACVGEKGEKGDFGHPGPPGFRGLKGVQGLPGSKGLPGEKGAAGDTGSSGPRGPQGPSGVIGSPGKPGLQGPPGNTGSQGPVGPPGFPGVKGEKGVMGEQGNLGPRGIAGADGQPGPPGHRGPTGKTGSKGEKGSAGDPGHKGESGPQGIAGPPIDAQTLKEYFEPVKTVQSDVKSMETTITNLVEEKLAEVNNSLRIEMNAVNDRLESLQNMPAAHLSGSNSNHGPKSDGSTITDWYSGSGSILSPYLRGGITYSNGILTVPQGGLYYVYAQLYFYHNWGNSYEHGSFSINVNGSGRATSYHRSKDNYHMYYTGLLVKLQKGDRISIQMRSGANYLYTYSWATFFGAFRLP